MSDPAAFTATFSDLKTIKTRSVVSFHFEVAIEQADQALAILGGLPKSGAEIHVAIARLQAPAKEVMPHSSGGGAPFTPAPDCADFGSCTRYGACMGTLCSGFPTPGGAPFPSRAAPSEPEEPTRKVDTTKSERAKASYRMSDDGERAVTRACSWRKLPTYWQFLKRFGHDVTSTAEAREGQLYAVGVATMAEVKSDPAAFQRFWDHETDWKIFNGELAQPR